MTAKPIQLAQDYLTDQFQGEWEILRGQAEVNQQFKTLEVKAFYIYGLIYDLCQSVECLLRQPNAWPYFYLPAYTILASAVELLGRCLRGDDRISGTAKINIQTGFHFLANKIPLVPSDPDNIIVVSTSHQNYSISDLVAMRNFTAHGQAANNALPARIDSELMGNFPQLLGNAMENYWSSLQNDTHYCENLAKANIRPLVNRYEPIAKITTLFSIGCAGSPFYQLNWRVGS
ncbi:MAG: hypothetical protein JXA42_10000 [Anaerolineales bacterium]|nr:hypothetical protein [Anaerolineales bacterium]